MDCFRTYGITKLNDRQFVETRDAGYTLTCPAGCENSHIKDAHHFRLLGDVEYERFHRFGTEEFVLQAGGVLCPKAGCGMGLLPETRGNRLQCTNCRV
jgi:parkin